MHKLKLASDHPADEDPLAKALAPPPDESPTAREARLAEEAAAQRRSDAIDEELNRQRLAEKKAPKCIRILLLGPVPIFICTVTNAHAPLSVGQSESGMFLYSQLCTFV
jgi:hypothetical protein